MFTLHNDDCSHKGTRSDIATDCGCERRFERNETYADAQIEADRLNALHSDKHFLACDAGSHVSPRYSVKEAPSVGDKVSYAFNGDYYPCGVITKISDSYRRIETSEGKVFWRRKLSGGWVEGGTWSLVAGHISRINPSF